MKYLPMKAKYSVVLILFLFYQSQTTAQKKITGRVTDIDNIPLVGAAVYFNNTSIGTTTNDEGEFEIFIQKDLSDLIISYLGYETIQYTINPQNHGKRLVFKMIEKANMLDEIVLSNKKISERDRLYYLSQFRKHFIGQTNLSKECIILNEDVIKFKFDHSSRTLEAYSYEPIKIKNKGLGYLISYDLVLFQLTPQKTSYLGYTQYQELKATKRKKRKWKKRRMIAYNGSKKHFLQSIIKNNLKKEGFIVDQFKTIPNPNRPHDTIIEKAISLLFRLVGPNGIRTTQIVSGGMNVQINSNLEIPSIADKENLYVAKSQFEYETKRDSLKSIIRKSRLKKHIDVNVKKNADLTDFSFKKENLFYLSFPNLLKITYTKEAEEDGFRPGKAKLDYQVSTIFLVNKKNTAFGKDGFLYNPLDSMIRDGYWSYEKMADTLPLDFEPNQ